MGNREPGRFLSALLARASNLRDELGAVQSRHPFPVPRSLQTRALRQVEHEVEPGSLLELSLHTELATHRHNELLADR